MKKPILIILGILAILIGVAVWSYLFIFGVPKSTDEIFARFSGDGDPVVPANTENQGAIDVEDTTTAGMPQKLKQLTTRPVAGAAFSEKTIYYVEQGTGHIYSINLETGDETLVSGTTIPGAREATFSDDSTYVAITAYGNGEVRTVAGMIPPQEGGSYEGISLPTGATDVQFDDATGTLNYLLKGETSASGHTYNLTNKKATTVFTIPLRDVRVIWGDITYVYTTPTKTQKGFLYQVENGTLTHTMPGGYALLATTYSDGVIQTVIKDSLLTSSAYTNTGTISPLPIFAIPEKCTENKGKEKTLFCTTPIDMKTADFPDLWYKGAVSYTDLLWGIDVEENSATVLSDLLEESGREIDVRGIGTNDDGTYIYLINKNDSSLWMYDTTVQ